jgi:antibiotic biosynthesis monooxygenase (ABM) superfamily enzyme
MIPSSQEPGRPPLEIRGARASSVIVQRIPAHAADAFLQWQRGISAEAAKFPGYQTTEVFPPTVQHEEWVAIIHFDDARMLQDWLDSPQRAEWIAKLPCDTRNFRLKTLPAGFGAWFTGRDDGADRLPHWKMFLTVLFGLYPTVALLSLFLLPYTQRFGPAIAILIGNIASVSFLEWLGMPVLSRLLRPWLNATGKEGRVCTGVGLILIVAGLGAMAFVFNLMFEWTH